MAALTRRPLQVVPAPQSRLRRRRAAASSPRTRPSSVEDFGGGRWAVHDARGPRSLGTGRAPIDVGDAAPRVVEVVVDGWRFELEVEDAARAELIERGAPDASDGRRAGGPLEVRAIIPGTDRRCRRSPSGDTVDGRPATPGRGGDEDAERAPCSARRDRRARSAPRPGPPSSSATCSWSSAEGRAPRRSRIGRRPERERWRALDACASARRRAGTARRASRRRRTSRSRTSTPRPTLRGWTRQRDLGLPGRVPVHARRPADDVPRPVLDDAPVRRLRHRRGDERALPLPARAGPDRACRSPSTCRPRWATTPTTRRPRARSAGSASRSARSPTWRCCSTGSRSARSSTSMTINATAADPAGALRGRGREAGRVARERSRGTIQNDILKEYIARGTYIFPPRPSMRLVTDVFEFCAARAAALEHDLDLRLPHARGRRDGGPGAGLHAGRRRSPTCEAAVERGLDVDDFAAAPVVLLRRPERALRGGRQVPGGPPDVGADHAGALRGHEPEVDDVPLPRPDRRLAASPPSRSTTTSSGRRSRRSPRCSAAPRASTRTRATRRSRCRPRRAARLALRTQQILAHEAGVTETPDPLAGSYYVESLTNELEAAAWTLPRRDRGAGRDARRRSRRGFQQREIQEAAYRVQRAIERGRPGRRRRQPLPRRARSSTPPTQRDRPGGRAPPGRAGPSGSVPSASAAAWDGRDGRARARRRGRTATSCRPSSTPCGPTRRSARSATACGSSGASTAS